MAKGLCTPPYCIQLQLMLTLRLQKQIHVYCSRADTVDIGIYILKVIPYYTIVAARALPGHGEWRCTWAMAVADSGF